MKALLLVDIQNDFMPGGALAVNQGNEIVPLVNELIHYPFDVVVATKDWHPYDHQSFAITHGKNTGEHIQIAGIDQILWPVHCVQGTWGSEFAGGWDTTEIDKVVYKGTDPMLDSYSTFYDNEHLKSTGLENYLREKGVQEIYIAGLATDYCVKYSALDALQLGFRVTVVVDACRGVNLNPDDSHHALTTLFQAGAVLTPFSEVKEKMEADMRNKGT